MSKLIPIGKKAYQWHELKDLPIVDGVMQVDGIVMGPDGKWWIDEEGNAYFDGEMTVEKDVDPKYINLVSQSGTAGAPNGSLIVDANVLKYKAPGGGVSNVPVGATAAAIPVVKYANNVPAPTNLPVSTSVTITPSSASAQIFVAASWFGRCNASNAGHTPNVTITRGGTTIGTYTGQASANDTLQSFWTSAMFVIDSPGTTATYTLNISTSGDAPSANMQAHHYNIVAFECRQGSYS